jgi:hypothetical protein
MQVKDRPEVEVKIDICINDCYDSGCVLAKNVSEKKDIPTEQLAEEIAAIVDESPEKILDRVRECIETGSCNRYLEPGRKILERKGRVFLTYIGIKINDCVIVNGYANLKTPAMLNTYASSLTDFMNDNKPHICFRQ